VTVTSDRPQTLQVQGLTAEQVGTIAWRAGLPVFELAATRASLEEAFMQATQHSVEYASVGQETSR
jgi:ABC-2 type transport system ATP-binding protein